MADPAERENKQLIGRNRLSEGYAHPKVRNHVGDFGLSRKDVPGAFEEDPDRCAGPPLGPHG